MCICVDMCGYRYVYMYVSTCVCICVCVCIWFGWSVSVHTCVLCVCICVCFEFMFQWPVGYFSSFSVPWWWPACSSGVEESGFKIYIRERSERTWTKERVIERDLLRHWTHLWLYFFVCVICTSNNTSCVCMCVIKELTLENLSKSCLI